MSLPDWSPGATRSLLLVAAIVCVLVVGLLPIALGEGGTDTTAETIESESQTQQVTEVLIVADAVSAANLTIQPGETGRLVEILSTELDVPVEAVVVSPGVENGSIEVREPVSVETFEQILRERGLDAGGQVRIGPTDETLVTTGDRIHERFDRVRTAPTLVETTQFDFEMHGLWILAENAHESWVEPVTNTRGEFDLLVEVDNGERETVLNRSHIERVGTRGFADGEPVVPVTLTESGAAALRETIREHDVGTGRECDPANEACFVGRIDDRHSPPFGVLADLGANDSQEMLIPTNDATESIWIETTLAVDPLPVPVIAETRTGSDIVGHPPDEGIIISLDNISVEPPPENDDPGDGGQSDTAETDGETYEPPPLPEEPADIAADEQGDGFTAAAAVAAVFLAALIGGRHQ